MANSTASQAYIIIDKNEDGTRLDRFLLRRIGEQQRHLVLRLIRKGNVRVNSKRCKPQHRLHDGDRLFIPASLRTSKAAPAAPAPLRFTPEVLYEDEALIVINKPQGMVVHGGSGHQHGLVEQLKAHWQCDELRLAHRLDRDTSGCLILARQLPALRSLSEQFRQRQAEKTYLAWVEGEPMSSAGRIRQALAKGYLQGGERMVINNAGGKDACTDFRLVLRYDWQQRPVSLLALFPHSGRTHQLRVHMQQEGCPILGDSKYASRQALQAYRQRGGKGLCLHAWRLRFTHPYHQRAVEVRAPWPGNWSVFHHNLITPE